MSFIKKVIGYIPIVVVMLISIAAFVPSFLDNDLARALDDDKEELNDLQLTFNWMSTQAENIYTFDSDIYTLMWQELEACHEIDVEWTTLGENATLLQNLTYANKIMMHLGRVSVLADQTYSYAIHAYFESSPGEDLYLFGTSTAGINYGVRRTDWNANPVYLQTSILDFLTNIYPDWYLGGVGGFFFNSTMNFLLANYAVDLNEPFNFLWAIDTVYTLDPGTNIYNLTHAPIILLEQAIDDVNIRIFEGESDKGSFQTAVSIMTVATLLATAISTRLEERKVAYQISMLNSEIKQDPDIVIPQVDKFSIGLLFVAVAIAITGLILVYWF